MRCREKVCRFEKYSEMLYIVTTMTSKEHLKGGIMAEFTIDCQGCGNPLEVLESWRGRMVKCPQCGASFRVPGEKQSSAGTAEKSDSGISENSVPLYMRQSAASAAYDGKRRRENAVNWIIRKTITLVFFCAVAFGLWWGIRFTLFRTSGMAIFKKVDGVVIFASGHELFFRAEKDGKAFTGSIADNNYSDPGTGERVVTGFDKYVFEGGYLVLKEKYTVEDDSEILLEKVIADNGRITDIITYTPGGKETGAVKYRYDWLGRAKSGMISRESGGKKVEIPIVFSYRWYGPIESVTIDFENDGEKLFDSYVFNSDGRVECAIHDDGKNYTRKIYEYSTKQDETKGMRSAYSIYNRNGRLVGKYRISYDNEYRPSESRMAD